MRTHNRHETARSVNPITYGTVSVNDDKNITFSFKDDLSKKKSTLVKTEV